MTRTWDVAKAEDGLPDLPAPGLSRRRMLRAAGVNLHIADFTDQEQADRGFQLTPIRNRPEPH